MDIVHLTASTFFGGPERQMLGLAEHLPDCRTTFLSFREGGRCQAFLDEANRRDFAAEALKSDTPHFRRAAKELAAQLRGKDLLLCHGYKANLIGRVAARRAGIPAVAVSRGWTGESAKVRFYESLDRWHLRFMDRVVAVSHGQAEKVLAAGVHAIKISVIRNAARLDAFEEAAPANRATLQSMVPGCKHVVLAAGRLSPEKGFDVLVEAATNVLDAGFILFGEGAERPRLEVMIRERHLGSRFKLAGPTGMLDAFLPCADLVVLPSHTEGLPNVALEASTAGVAVVATEVGGTPEAVADGETGLLVPAGDCTALAEKINRILGDEELRHHLGDAGRRRMREHFSFRTQAMQYKHLFEAMLSRRRAA